jgi:hypothetical protein
MVSLPDVPIRGLSLPFVPYLIAIWKWYTWNGQVAGALSSQAEGGFLMMEH